MQPSLNQRRRDATRVEVAEAAVKLFARDGYENVTAEMIAADAGVSLRTFYRLFSTKEAVLEPLAGSRARAFAVAFAARPEQESVLVAVQGAMDDLIAAPDTSDAQATFMRVLLATPVLYARWQHHFVLFEEALAPLVRERLGPSFDDRQAQYTTLVIVAALRCILERSLRSEAQESFSEQLRDALSYLGHGAGLV